MGDMLSSLTGQEPTESGSDTQTAGQEPVETKATGDETQNKGQEPSEPTATDESQPDESSQDDDKTVSVSEVQKQREKKRQAQKEAQELRLEVARLQGELSARQQNQQTQTNQPQDPFDAISEDDLIVNPKEALKKFGDILYSKWNAEQGQKDFNRSVTMAQQRYPDYMEKIKAFAEQAKSNPSLQNQMNSALDPAEFAYQYGKNFIEVSSYGGDIDSMREAIRKEERAKIEAELGKTNSIDTASKVPKTLATKNGAGETVNAPAESLLDLMVN